MVFNNSIIGSLLYLEEERLNEKTLSIIICIIFDLLGL